MELYKIENLIEKYLKAETTLNEEEILKKYFLQDDIPSHLIEYKILFNYFSNSKLDEINKTISLPKKRINLRWLSIAAAFVLMVSIFSIHQKNVNEKEEARLAYMETQRALNLISYNLNKGNSAVAQLKTFENTQNKIFINK
ncbi:MAG: hypothetical protein ABFR32_10745 [Bacteroidota bacterium]